MKQYDVTFSTPAGREIHRVKASSPTAARAAARRLLRDPKDCWVLETRQVAEKT